MSRVEKRVFCEGGILLLLSNLAVKAITFKRIENFLRAHWKVSGPGDCDSDYTDDIRLVKVSLSRATKLIPLKSPCLIGSIAEFIMLRRRGIPAVMYMGVKSSKDSLLLAHAWIVTGHEPSNGNSKNFGYAPLIVIR
jgi:hypothetical protein